MIDNVKFYANVHPPAYVFGKDCFTHSKSGFELRFLPYHPPLICKLNPYGVTVTGSLQKAYTGHNTGNFTRTEIETAAIALGDILELNPDALTVTRLEVKANIATPMPAAAYLQGYKTYKTKPFYPAPPPNGFARPLLVTAFTTDKHIKLYDTGTYNRLKTDCLLSYELVLKHTRTVETAAKQPVTLANLATVEVLTNLTNTALNTLKGCTYTPEILPPDVITRLGNDWVNNLHLLCAPPNFWVSLKAANPKTYYQQRQRLNDLKTRVKPYLPTDLTPLVQTYFTQMLSH